MEYYKRNEEMSLFTATDWSSGHNVNKKTKDRKYNLFMKGGGEGINTIYMLFHSIFFNGKNNSKTDFF